MALIYITGVAGSGKSTARQELLRRGYMAVGGSEDHIAAFYNNATGQRVERSVPLVERTSEWLAQHTWKIPHEALEHLRSSAQDVKDRLVFVCSGTANEDGLWGLFDKIFALTVDKRTAKARLGSRTGSDWGSPRMN